MYFQANYPRIAERKANMNLLEYMMEDYGAPAVEFLAAELGLGTFEDVNFESSMAPEEKRTRLEKAVKILMTPETMVSRLSALSDSEMALFERACRGPVKLEPDDWEDAMNVSGSRYAFRINTDEKMQLPDADSVPEEKQIYLDMMKAMAGLSADYLEVPEDVVALYDSINTPEFQRRRHRAYCLTRCLDVCKALYGSEPVSVVCRLMERELGESVEEEEILSLFHMLPDISTGSVYDSDKGRIASKRFRGTGYEALIEKQQGKDFYIPSPAEAEDLVRWDSIISSPAYLNYRSFLENYCGIDPEETCTAGEELWKAIVSEKTPPECVQLMIDWSGVDASCMKLLRTMYRACLIETRFPIHCGQTLAEVHAECPDLEEYDFSEIKSELEQRKSRSLVRIGRNDRCPCGSGKKYKKCCMM